MVRRLNERLAKLEADAKPGAGKRHLLFVFESWDRERVLDDYGRDKIADGDSVQFLVWKDGDEPAPYPVNRPGWGLVSDLGGAL